MESRPNYAAESLYRKLIANTESDISDYDSVLQTDYQQNHGGSIFGKVIEKCNTNTKKNI